MNAPTLAASRRGRFATWFAPPAEATIAHVATTVDSRTLVERRLYDEIGEFLFAHGLSPTPAHFEIAHAYLAGSDPELARKIAMMIAQTGKIDRARIAALGRPETTGAQALATLADRLEFRLSECLSVADRTHSSARDYGDALDIAQTRLASDPGGTLAHIAGLTRAVVTTSRLIETELKQTRRETEQLRGDLDRARDAADHDHLTGLPNRRGLERRLAELTGAPDPGDPGTRATVALCDIDDFKAVNDVHGHQAGDRVLKFVGDFLRTELGAEAFVARHGGEEFAVLIVGRGPDDAWALLDDVRARLAARSLINQDTDRPIGRITFSAGLAALGGDGARALGQADIALYQAKRDGKNRVATALVPD